jgi:hypothetical protein
MGNFTSSYECNTRELRLRLYQAILENDYLAAKVVPRSGG